MRPNGPMLLGDWDAIADVDRASERALEAAFTAAQHEVARPVRRAVEGVSIGGAREAEADPGSRSPRRC